MARWTAVLAVGAVVVAALSIGFGRQLIGSGGGDKLSPEVLQKLGPASARFAKEPAGPPVGAMEAVRQAAEARKYAFAFFWKEEGEATAAMRRVFDAAMQKAADRARPVVVRVDDPAEKQIVEKYDLQRAPMPLVLAIAPNGAVMGGFPRKCSEEQLLGAFGTRSIEACMKALQEGKLVFLCVQNASTSSNEEAMAGVRQFQADSRFAEVTQVVTLDPADAAEAPLLTDLKIDPKTLDAVTVFLAPPGAAVAKLSGATKKEMFVSALEKASSGCCPGGSCAPGACK